MTDQMTRPRCSSNFASIWLTVCFLLGGSCILAGLWPSNDSRQKDSQPKFLTKNIEDIQESDYVLARDEFGNEIGMRRVVEVYRRTSDHLRILTFEASDGRQQTLETTDGHPFWVVQTRKWVDAKDLKVGDQAMSPHGELQTLLSTEYVPKPEGIAVFNFQVEGYHTYYVREQGTRGPPVLVHNADYSDDIRTADGRYISSEDLDRPGMNIRRQGEIYRIPGGNDTLTDKDYIGSTVDINERNALAEDGRFRSNTDTLDYFLEGDNLERYSKERMWLESHGGLPNTDNKILPPDPDKW